MLQRVGLFNCLPPLAAWVVFSRTLEARLQEKSFRSDCAPVMGALCPKCVVSSAVGADLQPLRGNQGLH